MRKVAVSIKFMIVNILLSLYLYLKLCIFELLTIPTFLENIGRFVLGARIMY